MGKGKERDRARASDGTGPSGSRGKRSKHERQLDERADAARLEIEQFVVRTLQRLDAVVIEAEEQITTALVAVEAVARTAHDAAAQERVALAERQRAFTSELDAVHQEGRRVAARCRGVSDDLEAALTESRARIDDSRAAFDIVLAECRAEVDGSRAEFDEALAALRRDTVALMTTSARRAANELTRELLSRRNEIRHEMDAFAGELQRARTSLTHAVASPAEARTPEVAPDVAPEPVEPPRAHPEPVEPAPVEPEPVEPEPVEPQRVEPERVEPERAVAQRVEPVPAVVLPPVLAPVATAPVERPVGTAFDGAGAEPVRLTVPLHALTDSLGVLGRSSADAMVRVDTRQIAGDAGPVAVLRLSAVDVAGNWEYHDVPVGMEGMHFRSVVLDLAEVTQAADEAARFGRSGNASLVIDDGVSLETTLLVPRAGGPPPLPAHAPVVESVDLAALGKDATGLDTGHGRVALPSRLLSTLRTRRATDADLVTVNGRPHLDAQLAPTMSGTPVRILAPLVDAETGAPVDGERRSTRGEEVTQLISAMSTESSAATLEHVLAHGVAHTRRLAAANPALPVARLRSLLEDDDDRLRAAAAGNPSITAEAVDVAAADHAVAVRAAIAGNRAATPAVLAQLAADADATVRARVAANPDAPEPLLTTLAADGEPAVRAAAAANVELTPALLTDISHDPEPLVCAAVAANVHCPPAVLTELAGVAPERVMANPQAPASLLAAGSKIHDARLRTIVAANPSTPARNLEALSRDDSSEVLRAVAANAAASPGARRRAKRRLRD